MIIKNFEVTGLMGRPSELKLNFNNDINIITGRNGSGKTSILKLMWYIISGNILKALNEVNFKKATVTTDFYQCTVHRISKNTCKVEVKTEKGTQIFEDVLDEYDEIVETAEDQANEIITRLGSSIFFPTFRRIEGGFTLEEQSHRFSSFTASSIEDALESLSKRLSNKRHTFVAALSTSDISSLLSKQYTDLSDSNNKIQKQTTQLIIDKIKKFKKGEEQEGLKTAITLIDDIKSEIESMDSKRDDIMKPLLTFRDLAIRLLNHSGINLGQNFSFGDAAHAINSDYLSAGEKQLLSFIAYNAFNENSVIFIDEPELSLHVDWQRQLFGILTTQQKNNQFIFATHSPFIYSKYPEKEILIDSLRGDEGAIQ